MSVISCRLGMLHSCASGKLLPEKLVLGLVLKKAGQKRCLFVALSVIFEIRRHVYKSPYEKHCNMR